ncbi:thioredoxin domain-containing protein [Luteolibacter pohnpeiensis]|uniref:Thioredoxin domain-containing protein n=1 Tax=Luteolibacter pohnpeiensis TaxID=454153 RepID=A0A934S572_9BACT|nr:thioredoxin domain-containing protein [Luteolibacter pohnpeiensis]MBK1883315.1 thioredoxin domain-containing protein [Luteolibacter pohnpeiensis]
MPNALIHETSPYLLQHAHNPVDWHAWSDEVFQRAKAEDKLVFLSIGYSTCHWCHVMERESFENEKVAQVMNHHFINVKVDREERPDIDATYMAFVQATTGQGGWPMSVWLTPDGKAVVGGTYFPPEDRQGRAGFVRLCHEIARLWRDDRTKMESSAARVMEHLQKEAAETVAMRGLAGPKVFGDFLDRCESMFDSQWGGFGGAPKFPRPVVVRALMQLVERFGMDSEEGHMAWEMVERTLKAMSAGGMHDQLGGGFHRYSVDRYWHVPHYEKMLYDQGQLAMAYLDAWQISGNVEFLQVVEELFQYLLDEMRDDRGGFHAAEDADSLPVADAAEKREGAYWTWEAGEIYQQLDARSAAIFCAAYGVQAEGNARPESDPHGELEGQNTLFRAMQVADLAAMFNLTETEIQSSLNHSKSFLLEVRIKRPLPHRDDKMVTAWNGLAIGALARAARLLDRESWGSAAKAAANFIQSELWDGETLFRAFRGQRGTTEGFPADYVFLISGLLELHGAFPAEGWLVWAEELQRKLDQDFWEASQAGYVMTSKLQGKPLLVIREDYDGAEPSPNHLAAENLLKLAMLLDEPEYQVRAEALLRAGSRVLETNSFAAPLLLSALDLHERGVMKFQLPGGFHPALRQQFLPRAVFSESVAGESIVCEGQSCRPWEPAQSITNGK